MFIGDCNSVVRGNKEDMHRALQQAAQEFKLRWDKAKECKNRVHLEVNLNGENTPRIGKPRQEQPSSG